VRLGVWHQALEMQYIYKKTKPFKSKGFVFLDPELHELYESLPFL